MSKVTRKTLSKGDLMSEITEDLYEGAICNDTSSTRAMLESLVELLDEEGMRKFCDEWMYGVIEE